MKLTRENTRGILYNGRQILTKYVTDQGIWRLSKWKDGCEPVPIFSLEYQNNIK